MHRFVVLLCLLPMTVQLPGPRTGEDVLRLMHDRYAGRWYRTITFVQTTTFPDHPAETWYEAGSIPGKLRIDIAPLDSMRTLMFVGDSTIVFQGGRRVAAHQDRNLLLTLGFDVYGQPPETTVAQLRAAKIDLGKLHEERWNGTKVWVVGAAAGDTTHSQFWIDQDRLLFVRLLEVRENRKEPDGPPNLLDVTFEDYQRLGKGWVAPRVVVKLNGREVQREDYQQIRANVALQPDLYDTKTYRNPQWIGQ